LYASLRVGTAKVASMKRDSVEFHRSRGQRRLTPEDCRDLIDAAVAQALLK
jgi:hypothetical protein